MGFVQLGKSQVIQTLSIIVPAIKFPNSFRVNVIMNKDIFFS